MGYCQQGPQVLFYGYIEEGFFDSNAPKNGEAPRIDNAKVTVSSDGEVVKSINARNTGFYAVLLNSGQKYTVTFEANGHFSRSFELDCSNVEITDDEGAVRCLADVALFNKITSTDVEALLKMPSGRCKYDPATNHMMWDTDFAKTQKDKFQQLAEPIYAAAQKK